MTGLIGVPQRARESPFLFVVLTISEESMVTTADVSVSRESPVTRDETVRPRYVGRSRARGCARVGPQPFTSHFVSKAFFPVSASTKCGQVSGY